MALTESFRRNIAQLTSVVVSLGYLRVRGEAFGTRCMHKILEFAKGITKQKPNYLRPTPYRGEASETFHRFLLLFWVSVYVSLLSWNSLYWPCWPRTHEIHLLLTLNARIKGVNHCAGLQTLKLAFRSTFNTKAKWRVAHSLSPLRHVLCVYNCSKLVKMYILLIPPPKHWN